MHFGRVVSPASEGVPALRFWRSTAGGTTSRSTRCRFIAMEYHRDFLARIRTSARATGPAGKKPGALGASISRDLIVNKAAAGLPVHGRFVGRPRTATGSLICWRVIRFGRLTDRRAEEPRRELRSSAPTNAVTTSGRS